MTDFNSLTDRLSHEKKASSGKTLRFTVKNRKTGKRDYRRETAIESNSGLSAGMEAYEKDRSIKQTEESIRIQKILADERGKYPDQDSALNSGARAALIKKKRVLSNRSGDK